MGNGHFVLSMYWGMRLEAPQPAIAMAVSVGSCDGPGMLEDTALT